MKKAVGLIICVLMLCAFCIPCLAYSASNEQVAEDLENYKSITETRFQNYLNSSAVEVPIENNKILLDSLTIDAGWDTVPFYSLADVLHLEGHDRDGFTVIPKDQEDKNIIYISLRMQLPYATITERVTDIGEEVIDVILSDITESQYLFYETILERMLNKEKISIKYAYPETIATIMRHGGNSDDLKELQSIGNEFIDDLDKAHKEKSDYLKELYDQYMAKHPGNDSEGDGADNYAPGSIFSGGSLTIIVGVACSVVFGISGFFLGSKKKYPALATGVKKEDEE